MLAAGLNRGPGWCRAPPGPTTPPPQYTRSLRTNKHPKIALWSGGSSGPSDQGEAPLPCSCRKVHGSEIRRSSTPGKGPGGWCGGMWS